MGITWRVVVVEDGDVGATQCLAIRGLPFRFLPGLGCAVEIAGRRQSDAPEVVHVLLALRDQDGVPVGDRLRYLVDAIERLGSLLCAPFPAAIGVACTQQKTRFAPLRIAHFLEAKFAVLDVVVGGLNRFRLAVAPIALFRSAPVTIIAAPPRTFLVDLDAAAFPIL